MEKIAKNYLEIKSLDELLEKKKPNDKYIVKKVSLDDFQLNKFFYKQIGKNHQWNDRLVWNDKKWIDYVSNTNVFTFVLKDNEDIAGFFELIYHKDKSEMEIAYFGLLKDYMAKKLGGFMGQIMQASEGQANPQQVNQILLAQLQSLIGSRGD